MVADSLSGPESLQKDPKKISLIQSFPKSFQLIKELIHLSVCMTEWGLFPLIVLPFNCNLNREQKLVGDYVDD